MYYVYDYVKEAVVMQGTQQEIALWWRGGLLVQGKHLLSREDRRGKPARVDFTQLNVTGKDVYRIPEQDGWYWFKDKDGHPYTVPKYVWVAYLRRYQVFDDAGRSIDIRAWDDSVWHYVPPRQSSQWYPGWMRGAKFHHHRTSGPSMWRGTLRAAMDVAEIDEDLPLPIRDNTKVRLPFGGTEDSWSYYDRHYCHWKSASWKDQTKARKQWAKHKTWGKKPARREENDWAEYEDELVLSAPAPVEDNCVTKEGA